MYCICTRTNQTVLEPGPMTIRLRATCTMCMVYLTTCNLHNTCTCTGYCLGQHAFLYMCTCSLYMYSTCLARGLARGVKSSYSNTKAIQDDKQTRSTPYRHTTHSGGGKRGGYRSSQGHTRSPRTASSFWRP